MPHSELCLSGALESHLNLARFRQNGSSPICLTPLAHAPCDLIYRLGAWLLPHNEQAANSQYLAFLSRRRDIYYGQGTAESQTPNS